MDEKCCLVFGIILCLTVISESREIARRALSKDESHENGEIPLSINPLEKGKKLGLKPAILGSPSVDADYYYDDAIDPVRRPPENDYNEPERGVDKIDSRFPTDRELGERPQGNPKEKDDTDKTDDDNFNKPLDEEDSNKPGSNDKDAGPSVEEEENPIYKDRDESGVEYTGAEESEEENSDKEYEPEEEEKLDEERKEEEENYDKEHIPEEKEKPDEERKAEEADEKHEQENDDEERKEEEKHEPENDDEERKEEEEKHEPENDDEKKYVPEEELVDDDTKEEMPKEVDEETEIDDKDDESISKDGEEGSSSDSSIFDTPFFNLERVKKYFGHLDRALGHVFSDTVDEALMLNGTVTNTTEEEVDIDGKKFIITKSLIKGGDNSSSIYIEALSAKPKMNDSEVMEDFE